MNPGLLRSTSAVAIALLSFAGCESLTPGENAAVFGGASAFAASHIARAAGLSSAQSLATGAAVGAVVAVTTYIIAKHQATVRQRQIAEQRARLAFARRQREEAAARRTGRARPRARYIAVDTVKDERSSPKAKKSIMIWDTRSQEIVGNNVYDVESTPALGSTAKFETYSAEYVGSGS
jgi:hypothetical protein